MPYTRRATRLGLTLALALATTTCAREYSRETVTWKSSGTALEGTLYLPKGPGPHAATVFIHGSGNMSRSSSIFRRHAERLASRGLAMLIYDKRGTGKSTGDWREADLFDLAQDALGGVRALRQDARIDAESVGLFGSSQGGWVSLVAADKDPAIAFIVTLSGPTITPAEQGHFIVEKSLRDKGYSPDEVHEAVDLDRRIVDVYRTGVGWSEAEEALEAARERSWFADAGIGIQARDSWNWQWYRDFPLDFDPLPLLESLDVPLFAAHGENDALVPAGSSVETLETLQQQLSKDFTNVLYPDVGHVLSSSSRRWRAPAGYWSDLEAWLRERSLI